MFVRVVAPETKFAVGPLAQAGDGALGTPGAQDQENGLFSLMKVMSSVFFCVGTNCLLCSREHLARKAAARAQPSFPLIRPAGRHMREDAPCKKQAHRFRTVGMLCTACEKRLGGVLTYSGTLHARPTTSGTCCTKVRASLQHGVIRGCTHTECRYQTGRYWCHHHCCCRIAFAEPPSLQTEVTKGRSRVLA